MNNPLHLFKYQRNGAKIRRTILTYGLVLLQETSYVMSVVQVENLRTCTCMQSLARVV